MESGDGCGRCERLAASYRRTGSALRKPRGGCDLCSTDQKSIRVKPDFDVKEGGAYVPSSSRAHYPQPVVAADVTVEERDHCRPRRMCEHQKNQTKEH